MPLRGSHAWARARLWASAPALPHMSCPISNSGALVADGVVSAAQADGLRRFLESCPLPQMHPRALTASFWSDADTCLLRPRSLVEACVGRLLRREDVRAAVGEVAGVEWWWQDVDQDDPPKVYHVDQNTWMEDGEDGPTSSRRCPSFGSVLFLCDAGGPTAVFAEDVAAVIVPRVGRYFIFDGERPHGVLAPVGGDGAPFERLTLLLNYWRERPPGLSDAPEVACADDMGHIAEVPRCDNVWPRQRLPAELQPLCAPPTCCAGIRYRSAIDLVY